MRKQQKKGLQRKELKGRIPLLYVEVFSVCSRKAYIWHRNLIIMQFNILYKKQFKMDPRNVVSKQTCIDLKEK